MARSKIRGKLTNMNSFTGPLRRTIQDLDQIGERAVINFRDEAVLALQDAAPRGLTGNLGRGIRGRRRGKDSVDITIHARAESGFDYAGVSRFGHEVEEIVPLGNTRALAVQFQSGDKGTFDRVRGFEPNGDWVDNARPAIDQAGDEVARVAGAEIELRLFT